MYFDTASDGALDARPASLTVVMASTGLLTLLFFLFPAALIGAAQIAVASLAG
jgi:NADH-quinone oxidoreductase subunit N